MTLKEMVKDKTVKFVAHEIDGFVFGKKGASSGILDRNRKLKSVFSDVVQFCITKTWIRKQLDEQKSWDKIRSGGGPGSTCSKEEWFSQPKVLSGAGSEVETLPEDEEYERPEEMSPELRAANARLINSILRARIPEENILRFTEEDLEDQP